MQTKRTRHNESEKTAFPWWTRKDNAITRSIVSSMKPIIPFDKMFESVPGFSYYLANITY
jgi:hypothetical protein